MNPRQSNVKNSTFLAIVHVCIRGNDANLTRLAAVFELNQHTLGKLQEEFQLRNDEYKHHIETLEVGDSEHAHPHTSAHNGDDTCTRTTTALRQSPSPFGDVHKHL
jgi:hypothetical protein